MGDAASAMTLVMSAPDAYIVNGWSATSASSSTISALPSALMRYPTGMEDVGIRPALAAFARGCAFPEFVDLNLAGGRHEGERLLVDGVRDRLKRDAVGLYDLQQRRRRGHPARQPVRLPADDGIEAR